ncbi:hypothetical protein BMR85_015205 [Achromobacter sp. KAs 3-5]|nr:hypothetical protein BMR85_015205 [Achromobacter sp. KAs 3-5]
MLIVALAAASKTAFSHGQKDDAARHAADARSQKNSRGSASFGQIIASMNRAGLVSAAADAVV